MREIREVFIHCADTPANMDIGAAEIEQWHIARKFVAIGYAIVIRRDGTFEKGRDLDGDGDVFDEVGAHALGHNQHSVGICLVGGKGGFNFTAKQMKALEFLVQEIRQQYPGIKVRGHNEVSEKECPCFDVAAYFS